MAQLKDGTVQIFHNSNRVIASSGVDWSGVVVAQALFSLIGTTASLIGITAKTAPGVSASGNWELTLASNLSLANTTIASGSNGASLPQGTINVASTSGFLSAGTLIVATAAGPQTVNYTGKTSNSFTGCTGGTGAMATGGAVSQTLIGQLYMIETDFVRVTISSTNYDIPLLTPGDVQTAQVFSRLAAQVGAALIALAAGGGGGGGGGGISLPNFRIAPVGSPDAGKTQVLNETNSLWYTYRLLGSPSEMGFEFSGSGEL
jgi:hypothetical protein